MLNLAQLHHFKLVAQTGSFARAAEHANITQPALSNSIRSLEAKLGFTLFERSERPIALTPMARNILHRVDALMFEARNLDQALGNLASGQGGHIRLGMTAVYSTALGGPIVAEFHNAHPHIKLDLVMQETNALVDGLHDESLDLIVGETRELPIDQSDTLDITELFAQPGGAFCRAGHPILSIRQPKPVDLARYRFAGTHFPSEVEYAFGCFIGRDPNDTEPMISIDSHNIAALRDAAVESNLILLTTRGTVRNALALGVLKQIPIELGINGHWSLALRRGRVVHPAVPKLIQKIIEISKRDHDQRVVPYVAS
ncbi:MULTISPECIES: LysR family transcriptional regulator [Halocynthiibacter]|uniref:LysR family transcriptional regulator n=1 Tax=Halocynthiibacter halioticoli TaxID=2986804 RepID=A0AAE3J0F5_9RHOB|nr:MULTISPECIES: LysR family transcriptional regulator [Halocynthiibacter]MCV6822932.1 LysR family transcriptional regulator [Halocynthiibacter halioticoli]MCW4055933.1 LysR family transcriptional regulator [Halocynthiibacter sp. SDUM655004]